MKPKYHLDHPQIKRAKSWGNKSKGQKKVAKVMREYHEGELEGPSGKKIKSEDRAKAIAMSEAGLDKK